MSHRPIWFIGQIVPELCEKLIEEFKLFPSKQATMGEGHNGTVDNSHRNTTVHFISPEHPLTNEMKLFGEGASKECDWEYELTGNENIQFAEYAVGQHYDWHVDTFILGLQKIDRKVTVIILLSDPDEYEGGELTIRLYDDYKPALKKGSIIAFPSILQHKVTPVTKGVRYSATMWINGPRFK
jgi:PKHD-type hydroxylase